MAKPRDILLEVENLHSQFNTESGIVKAVNGVSFVIHPGEVLGIVGESGSGKTVTALSILNLLPHPTGLISAGDVRWKGSSILQMKEHELQDLRGKEISIIFQDPVTSMNPVIPIGEQVAEAIRQHYDIDTVDAEERTVTLLELVGIPDAGNRLHDYPHQFSGGMLQRLMIAQALSCNPDLVIADEPTSSLDVTIQAQVLDLLRSLKKELGMSIILITHDIGIVASMADRVAVMYCGQIVEIGGVFDIFEKAAHPYTRGLLASIATIDSRRGEQLQSISGTIPNPMALPSGCPFNPRCNQAMPECHELAPQVTSLVDGHQVRCLLYGTQLAEFHNLKGQARTYTES